MENISAYLYRSPEKPFLGLSVFVFVSLFVSKTPFHKIKTISTHFYQPFQQTFLVFSLSASPFYGNESTFILNDLQLNDQPLPPPLISLVFFLIRLCLLICGWHVNFKVIEKMKNDNGLLAPITKFVAINNCNILLGLVVFETLNEVVYPVNEILGDWFCEFFLNGSRFENFIVAFYSLITAIMRYSFIVHEKGMIAYGKERAKRAFTLLGIFLPLVLAIWASIIFDKNNDTLPINLTRCYGFHTKSFFGDTPSLDLLKHGILRDNEKLLDSIPTIVARVSEILLFTVVVLMGSNIIEGYINYKTLSYLNKYEKIIFKYLEARITVSRFFTCSLSNFF